MSVNFAEMGIVEPKERIKHLSTLWNTIEVEKNIPIKRYYRSGMEMVRMAHVYLQEDNLENAYVLYMKFLILFLEKIQSHPDHKKVPADLKQPNQAKLKEILPISEKLKARLTARYEKEYAQFLADQKVEKEKEAQRAREAALREKAEKPQRVVAGGGGGGGPPLVMPTAPPLDNVVYPNDFPAEPSPADLILPDPAPPKPKFDRQLKPSSSFLDGALRTVVVPESTMEKFLKLALANTRANIETCGILAGRLAQNKLIISHVILPKQKGTADSCNTMNEEEIFDIQDNYNLITLGWIHTHPSQTAFLSSVDLHTHCSYQLMMPEAIAIVCSPKYQTTGFYSLTLSYGLDFISQCRLDGFHPHPNDSGLYMDAQHILLDKSASLEVIDLRS